MVPRLYHTISNPPREIPIETLEKNGWRVRNLCLIVTSVSEVCRYLAHCSNLEGLALLPRCNHAPCPSIHLLDTKCQPTTISGDLKRLFKAQWPPFSLPFFRNVTHLELVGQCCAWGDWWALGRLPNLTHLAISGTYSNYMVRRTLEIIPSLKALILTPKAKCRPIGPGYDDKPKDVRFVDLRPVIQDADPAEEWMGTFCRDKSFWTAADDVISTRLSSE